MRERDLVDRAKAGDPDAFAELVERHQQAVFSFLFRYAGQTADAEDLCQEVFVRALRNIKRFRGQSRIRTWLFAIAANLARDWQRRERRRRKAEIPADDAALADCPDGKTRNGPEASGARELAEGVRRVIGSLPPRERTAVVLRTYHDLEYEEIAQVIGCSTNAVGSLLFRARRRLAARLAHFVDEAANPARRVTRLKSL
jgi:RNA polymerase sigma-70 factor (ECF subfamily)